MAITQKHVINIQPGVSAPLVIHCSQGDTGTVINLTVVNGDEEFDCSSYACSVHGTRSDRANWGPFTCNVSGSTVSFSLTSDMTAVAGSCLAEVSIGTVGTANFALLVENATFESGVTYSNDVSVYQNILTAVQTGITNETAERVAAVETEKNERIAAVNAEATARQTADNTLQGNINSEAATRASADSNLQSQINQIVAPSGEAPSAAEVENARIGADGRVYGTLGDAIRTQNSDLKSTISVTKESTEELISRFIDETSVELPSPTTQAWFVDGYGNQSKDGWMIYQFSVTPGEIYKVNAENYNHEADAVVLIVKSGDVTLEKYAEANNRVIIIPENATQLIVNRNWRNSPTPTVSICEVSVPSIWYYENIADKENTDLYTTMTGFGAGSVSENVITVSGVNGGAWTNDFLATSNVVIVDVAFTSNLPITAVQLAVQKNDNSFLYIPLVTTHENIYDAKLTFDAAYYHVYSDAKLFKIVINSIDSSASGTITVTKLKIYESSTFQQNALYDDELIPMMEKVFSKTTVLESNIEQLENEKQSELCDPNGHKYSLQISANGSLIIVPHIPSDVLFMGNSLLLGMDTNGEHGGAFGMAATSYTKDFCYLVEQEILRYNASCQFDKQHVTSFEMGDWSKYISSYASKWTGKDLVILQIGDNVNTVERAETFTEHFPDLVQSIRTLSPNARVILVGVWFGATAAHNALVAAAEKYGCIYINIADLCVSENFATEGETITYKDGTTGTMQAAWVSHPGDAGMEKIAERIIETLNMQ